jgi:hypothetical protein
MALEVLNFLLVLFGRENVSRFRRLAVFGSVFRE